MIFSVAVQFQQCISLTPGSLTLPLLPGDNAAILGRTVPIAATVIWAVPPRENMW